MLDAEIPLHRVRVLCIRIHEPLHLVKRCQLRQQTAAGRKRVLSFHIRQELSGFRNVQVVGKLLADVRPCAFIVLCSLGYRRPVVVNDAERRADGSVLTQAVGQTETRAPVGFRVVINLATGIDDHMLGQFSVAGDAGRRFALGARRGQLLHDVCPVIEIDGAGLDASVLADGFRLAIRRQERPVIA